MNAARFTKQRRDIERRFRDTPGRIHKALSALASDAGAAVIVIDKQVTGWRLKTGEIICMKTRFASEQVAQQHLFNIADANSGPRVPVRAYQCERCRGWHLTSQQKNNV